MQKALGTLTLYVNTTPEETRLELKSQVGKEVKGLTLSSQTIVGAKHGLESTIKQDVQSFVDDVFGTFGIVEDSVLLECPSCGLVYKARFQTERPKLVPCPNRECSCTIINEELTEVF